MTLRHSELHVRGPSTWLRSLVLVVFVALTCGAALGRAAPGPPRADDPDPPGGKQAGPWQVVQVPVLPSGASLGALWTDDPNQLYVWGLESERPHPPQGYRLPHSMLYHWDGSSWRVVIDVFGEIGVSIHGTGPDDVFAATSTYDGTSKMYHYDGTTWTVQALPQGAAAPAGVIAGTRNDIYFRSAYDVLRYDGNTWGRVHTSDDDMANALAYVGPNEVYANCCTGHCCWNGSAWCHRDCGTFANVGASWGMREFYEAELGIPHPQPRTLWMYAAGRSEVTNGFAVWEFIEDPPGSMLGRWETVLVDPQPAGVRVVRDDARRTPGDDPPGSPGVPGLTGDGVAMWGSSGWDVYAAGTLSGVGLLYHFDGTSWVKLTPIEDMPPIADVWGLGPGDVWVSFKDGRLLHYTGGIMNPNPPVATRRPQVVRPETRPPAGANVGASGTLAARVVGSGKGVLTIEYSVPAECEVSIAAFDVTGRRLATIESIARSSGTYRADWHTAGLARGVYYYQVKAGSLALSGRAVVLD